MKAIQRNGYTVGVITQPGAITDVQSALDAIMTAKYTHGTNRLAVAKAALPESFFILSTGIAGEILQKFINYQAKIAVFGDFSGYTSKPLQDFMYESNQGKDIFFAATQAEAVARLTGGE